MFSGSIVALVTPMLESGDIDYQSFSKLIDWHIDSGTNAIVVNGTTGESASLTSTERASLLQLAVEQVAGRVPVIAGTGSCSTAATIDETRLAASAGADACLVVTPYYLRPTQQGLYEHFRAVALSTELPVIVYNVPKRTGCDLLPATLAGLAHVKNIVGIKEATGDVLRIAAIKSLVNDRFCLLSGDDSTSLKFMQQGGHGVISVTANVVPRLFAKLCRDLSASIDAQLTDLNRALSCEPNPIPCKWALNYLGMIPRGIRLPLTVLSEPMRNMVESAVDAIKEQDLEQKIA